MFEKYTTQSNHLTASSWKKKIHNSAKKEYVLRSSRDKKLQLVDLYCVTDLLLALFDNN